MGIASFRPGADHLGDGRRRASRWIRSKEATCDVYACPTATTSTRGRWLHTQARQHALWRQGRRQLFAGADASLREIRVSTASLVTDWPAIAGTELAAYTAPERLKWPRGAEHSVEGAAPTEKGRAGATLVLRVDGARALDVQYKARQIIERINAYFGYAAIAELRILQAPVDGRLPPAPVARPAAEPLTHEVAHIADPGLRGALARLGAGVRAGR
jgi:hypothetical protein